MKPKKLSSQEIEAIEANTQLLIQASQKGDLAQVKKLLPVSNPKRHDSVALAWAAYIGHLEIVQLLLPVSDPKTQDSQPLLAAASNGHTDIVKRLIPVSDYHRVLERMISDNSNIDILTQCIDEYEALQQKERFTHILDAVRDEKNNLTKRKI